MKAFESLAMSHYVSYVQMTATKVILDNREVAQLKLLSPHCTYYALCHRPHSLANSMSCPNGLLTILSIVFLSSVSLDGEKISPTARFIYDVLHHSSMKATKPWVHNSNLFSYFYVSQIFPSKNLVRYAYCS